MSAILILFLGSAAILIGLVLWAVRPARIRFKTPNEVFDALSAPRHYYRLPQILQALKENDTEFLIERNFAELARRVRFERKGIALTFLNSVEIDYQTLLAASRMLAAMAPEIAGVQEWQRLRLSAGFTLNSMLLRFRVRTGLEPWRGFAQLSDMASQLLYRLEVATRRIGERAAIGAEFPSILRDGGGEPR
jgi:hypothetical protein